MRLLISEFGSKESVAPSFLPPATTSLHNGIALEVPPSLTEAKSCMKPTQEYKHLCLALSDNRQLMVVCESIHIWSLQNGRHLATLEAEEFIAYKSNVHCFLELPGNRLALGNFDSTQEEVHIWDLKNGNCINKPKVSITANSYSCEIASLSGDYFVTYRTGRYNMGSGLGHCGIWNKTNGKLLHKLPDFREVIPLKDNFFVTQGYFDHTHTELWVLEKNKCFKVRNLPITANWHSDVLSTNCIAFMNISRSSSGSIESNVILWDSKSDNCATIYKMQSSISALENAQLSSSGQYLVFVDGSKVITWDIVNSKLLPDIAPNEDWYRYFGGIRYLHLEILPYDLIATNDYRFFTIWNLKTGQCLINLTLRTKDLLDNPLRVHFLSDKYFGLTQCFLAGYGSIPYIYQFNSLDTLLQAIESACTSKIEPRYFVSKPKELSLQEPPAEKASVKIEEKESLQLPTPEEMTRSFPTHLKPLARPVDDDDAERWRKELPVSPRLLTSEFGSKESASPVMKLINGIALEVPPNLTEAKENLEKTYRTFSESLLALSDNRLLMPVCGSVYILTRAKTSTEGL